MEGRRAARGLAPAIVARPGSTRQLRLPRRPRRARYGSSRAARATAHRAAEPGPIGAGGFQHPAPRTSADSPARRGAWRQRARRGAMERRRQPLENKTTRATETAGRPTRRRAGTARNVDCQTVAGTRRTTRHGHDAQDAKALSREHEFEDGKRTREERADTSGRFPPPMAHPAIYERRTLLPRCPTFPAPSTGPAPTPRGARPRQRRRWMDRGSCTPVRASRVRHLLVKCASSRGVRRNAASGVMSLASVCGGCDNAPAVFGSALRLAG